MTTYEIQIRNVFYKVVAFKCRQFSKNYFKLERGKMEVRKKTIHICRVLYPEICDFVLREIVESCIEELGKNCERMEDDN